MKMRRLKKWITCICAITLLSLPLNVFASETTENEVNVAGEEEPVIEVMTPEEAEYYYKQLADNNRIMPRSDLGICDVGLSNSDGKLLVVYSTSCRGIASKIGVKNFTLQQKNGLTWKNIVIRNEYSENTDAFFGGFFLTNPEEGKKYRAHCVHYAVKNGTELSLYTETEAYEYHNN